MKQFYTVVLDRFATFKGTFATEPYEAGWADEAIVFIRIHELDEKTEITGKIQISMDGIVWIDEGTSFPTISCTGDYFVKVKHFGGWIRLQSTVSGQHSCKATISMAFKG